MASSSHNLSREAGLPGSFRWQDFTSSEDPENVQVLEQAQSSRWSLSTANTPLEGLFPSNARSFSRSKLVATSTSMSNLRAKPSYDESGRKKALLNKFRRHADPLIIPSAKKAHSLTLTVGIYGEKVGTKQFVSPYIESPICITPDSSSLTTSTSPIETSKSWKRRKNSLGKIVTYPTKILGKILPRRGDHSKESGAPPLSESSPTEEPQLSLRRAETTVMRPKRSSELQRPNEPVKRLSMASTQAIRAERFSFEHRSRQMDAKTPSDDNVQILRETTPPLPVLVRSMTQPGLQRRGKAIRAAPSNTPRPPFRRRSRSERRNPFSSRPTFPNSRDGLASESFLSLAEENSSETVATIANRIVAKELDQHQHDSWDFLDYYTQSGVLNAPFPVEFTA
ncbi:MAG: hypothetical protein NXY57DRAFT_962653 [Lentinula lateritia]|nr:MAG: hypothetical protein NXY57DRAFT_962653 [Lentinula lateritia]